METKIILINPPSTSVEDDRLEPNLGLLYIAATAIQNGYQNLEIYDMSGSKTEQDISHKIAHIPNAGIYGISCLCTNYSHVKRIIAHIRQHPEKTYIIVGGPNPTAMPEFTEKDSGADVVVVGEGENAFLYCIEQYSLGTPLYGIVHGKSPKNIDTYPFPARHLVDLNSYSRKLLGESIISLISSRGCSYHCTFCNSVVMGGGARTVRYRSVLNLQKEIEQLRENYRYFRFNDDCFTSHPKLFEILKMLSKLDIKFRIFARIEDLTKETCFALKSAGCVHVSIGLESLNPDNLRILGKHQQIGHEQNIHFAKEAGIVVRGYFLVGLPFDTDQTIDYYFSKAALQKIEEFSVYPLIPYPGTKIYNDPESFGYTIINNNFSDYIQIGIQGNSCFALRHRNFIPDDVKRWKKKAETLLKATGSVRSKVSRIAQ